MTRSATDVMQDIVFAAVIDSIMAMKTASRGLPNNLLRDLNAIHANTTFADLPAEVQAAIVASVRAGFTRLLKEGYSVSSGQSGPPPRGPAPHGGGPTGRFPRTGRPPAKRDGPHKPGQGQGQRRGGRPERSPKPRGS